jgi:hypothetical protein
MIELTIVVEEYDNNKDEYTGKEATRKVWWPCKPSIGEELTIDGDGFKITNVDHWIMGETENYPMIRVTVKCDIDDFKVFLNNPGWKKEYP